MDNVVQIIEEVCENMCDNYYKYRDQSYTDENELNDICKECPLNRLQ